MGASTPRANSSGHRSCWLLTARGDAVIAASVSVGEFTVYRTKRRFVEGNLDLALSEEAALALDAS